MMDIHDYILCVFMNMALWFDNIIDNNSVFDDHVQTTLKVPGDGGTQIQAKINEGIVPHYICYRHTEKYFELWLNLEELFPYVLECFVHNMRLQYDNKTHTTSNMPGVSTRINGWGNTSTVDYLDATHWSSTKYFITIINALVKVGYKQGVSLRGAPYDFRKAPNEMGDLYNRFQLLIEDTYVINGNKKVILLGHSMGNPVALYFLNRMSQAWKDKYIHTFISLAAPWGGAVKPVRLMASGDNLGVSFVNALTARTEQRSMPSTAWLLPSTEFWNSSDILVVAPKRNYTAHDYEDFFRDIDFNDGYLMYQDTQHLVNPLTPPNVTVHCLHGIGVDTPGTFVYDDTTWHNEQPRVIHDDGDGTVNIRSLHGCLGWKGKQKFDVFHAEFTKVSHMGILSNQAVLRYINKVLFD